ncbi:MAG: VOC family protein [Methylophilaceae bacterium]
MTKFDQHLKLWLALTLGSLVLLTSVAVEGRILEVKTISLTVSNIEQSVAFYEKALDFKKVSEQVIANSNYDTLTGIYGTRVKVATLQLGQETIQLEQHLTQQGRPVPVDSRSNDLWFQHFAIVVSDMNKAYRQLQQVSYQAISSAPQTIPESNKGAAGIKAYKFKDPDGHPLELLYFPADKGRAVWHQANRPVFEGIDHSAITISDTDRSLAFYRDLLGFTVAGQGLNTGATQEQLDNAFGAVVRITGLRGESTNGPGLEFLQYLTPSGGRATPIDSKTSDIAHAHLVVVVDNLEKLTDTLTKQGVIFVSSQVTSVNDKRQLMVKDPDGHAVVLQQP